MQTPQSVDISYFAEPALPPEIRAQAETLLQARLPLGSRLCIALLGARVLGVCIARIDGHFARIDALKIFDLNIKNRLRTILLLHSLKQLHRVSVNEVNVTCRKQDINFFLNYGFVEETITIPGLSGDAQNEIELVHPNIAKLVEQFNTLGAAQLIEKRTPIQENEKPNREHRSIPFDTLSEFKDLGDMIMSHASRKIWILSDSLNDPILADKSFSDRVHKLILSYRQAEVRILLENDSQRVVNSSPILQVAQKLSSFVSIRKLSDKRVMAKEWLYLFDDHSAIERKRELGYRGQAFIENPLVLQRLSYQFDNLWQHSVPSTELRRLAI